MELLFKNEPQAHTAQHLFFEFPKKSELSEQPAVNDQEELINGKNQQYSKGQIN